MRDGFGRLLAYVIAEGVNVNLELVRQGWSKYYTKYGKGRLQQEFEAAEAEARAGGLGLWGMVGGPRSGQLVEQALEQLRAEKR